MSIFKIIKISLIIFCITIISGLIVFVYNIYYSDNLNKNIENNITNNDKIVLNMDDDAAEIIRQTAIKNNKWEYLPLSKKFKKKYNPKDGILVNDNYTKLSWSVSGTDKQQQIITLIVFHNLKKEYYYIHYTVNDNNELDDVEIIDKKLLYDEYGKEVIYKETMNGAFVSNIILLAAPGRLEYDPFDYIYVTDRYLNKWSDGFIDYDISCGLKMFKNLTTKRSN